MAAFNWLFNDNEETPKEKHDRGNDGLNVGDFRNATKLKQNEGLPVADDLEITEEEIRLFENDPETAYMQKLYNDYPAKAEFYKIDQDILDEISNDDEFTYGHTDLSEYNNEEVPFEERDIMAERLQSYRDANEGIVQKKKVEHNPELDYTLSEFKLMEDAYKFKTLVNKETQDLLEKERPISRETSQPITESELASILEKYNKIKKDGNYRDFGPRELNFMKQCSNWNRLNREAGKRAKNPVMANGQVLTEKQINEVVAEYNELRDEKPEEFAELKVEDGKWEKGDFNWKEERFEGQKQYSHFEKKSVIGKDGKKKTLTTKYILKNAPLGFTDGKQENMYYVVGKNFRSNDEFGIKFIELKRPYPFKEVKEKKAA
jgi:hypothetical protein